MYVNCSSYPIVQLCSCTTIFLIYYLGETQNQQDRCDCHHLGLVARKPVFGVSDKVRFKPACSATETSQKKEISLVASLDMELYKTRITKTLIRLHGCAGWSAPVLFANPRRQVFSRRGPFQSDMFDCKYLNFSTAEYMSWKNKRFQVPMCYFVPIRPNILSELFAKVISR